MIKLTVRIGFEVHDWYVHEKNAVKWNPERVESHFKAKVKSTYGAGAKLERVADENDNTLWEKANEH